MRRKELNERSPLRVLEKSIHGGLGAGNLGVLVARQGVGKTALLVGIALDDLMRGRQVLHIGLDQSVTNMIGHYDEVFAELIQERQLEDVWQVKTEVERNRRLHAYLDGSFNLDRVRDALHFMRAYSEFTPSTIILEGMDLDKMNASDLDDLRAIAKGCDAEIWMSATTHRESDKNGDGIPEPVASHADKLDVILTMAHDGKSVRVSVLKDHDSTDLTELNLALDPTTMLLIQEPA